MPTFFTGDPDTPLAETCPVVAIAPGLRAPDASPAPGSETGGFPQRFGDETLASRLRRSLPDRELAVRWEATVALETGARFLVQGGERVFALGDTARHVFDVDGKDRGRVPERGAAAAVDGDGLVAGEASGTVARRKLEDGEIDFVLLSAAGRGWTRELFVPRGERLLVVSSEAPLMGVPRPPELTAFELFDLGSPRQAAADKLLTSATTVRTLYSRTRPILAAFGGGRLFTAVEDRIHVFSAKLELERILTGKFLPLALSADERGRLHLALRAGDEHWLWALEPTGERNFAAALPGPILGPPVVGYDRVAYVACGKQVLAFSPEGKKLFEATLPASVSSAAVTPCGRLLVSAGNELSAWTTKGLGTVLATLPGELVTPAIVTRAGKVVVATLDHVYLLGEP